MKFNLKVIAAAVALAAAGSAHADFVGANIGNSSLVIAAFNTTTNAAYYRDTGFLLNSFLPSSVTTGSGDGGVTGDKTPEAGLTLDKTNTASFADAAFGTWLSGQNVADIRWTAFASDSQSLAGTANVSRVTLALSTPAPYNNGAVTNAAAVVTGLTSLNPVGLSTTTTTVLTPITTNLGAGAGTLGTLGNASSLYYFARSQGTLANSTTAVTTQFGNSLNFASVTLAANGDFTYALAPAAVSAVPVPAAAWLFGSGLMAIGGAVRRRKAAAQA